MILFFIVTLLLQPFYTNGVSLGASASSTNSRKISTTNIGRTTKLHQLSCRDLRDSCKDMAIIPGKCDIRWMHSHCPVSCNSCNSSLFQIVPKKYTFNPIRQKTSNPHKVTINDAFSGGTNQRSGIPQKIPEYYQYNSLYINDAYQPIRDAKAYLRAIDINDTFVLVRSRCINQHDNCLQLALDGQCYTDTNIECGPICNTCEQLHVNVACPLPHINDIKNSLYPGDLNRMFDRIVSDPFLNDQYNITVLSQPHEDDVDIPTPSDMTNDTIVAEYIKTLEAQKGGPWIITIDNFVNDTEIENLLQWGSQLGFERSEGVSDDDSDKAIQGTGRIGGSITDARTSTQTWCTGECQIDPLTVLLADRIENVTGMSPTTYEPFQLLRYQHGQYYYEHHDLIDAESNLAQGVRILTVFIYLNDIVDGGGTMFTFMNLTIQPKRGRVVIWPSVLNNQPHIPDGRTMHEAIAVAGINEIKYAANVWIHQRSITKC